MDVLRETNFWHARSRERLSVRLRLNYNDLYLAVRTVSKLKSFAHPPRRGVPHPHGILRKVESLEIEQEHAPDLICTLGVIPLQ